MISPESIRLSIVIPALNEELRLPAALESIRSYLERKQSVLPAEIIVVDDGSKDQTAELVRQYECGMGVSSLCRSHGQTLGKGAAIRTGFQASRGEMILISDADLSAPIDQLDVLLEDFSADCLVIGSRAVDRSLIFNPQPLYRDLMGRSFNLMVRMLLLPGIKDTQCGFKLFPGKLARAMARVQSIDGFAWDVECLFLARFWGFAIRERAVRWAHVEASRVLPGRHSLQMFRDVMRLGFRRIRKGFQDRPEGLK